MADHWKSCGKSDTGSDYTLYIVADQDADHRIDLGGDAWLLLKDADGCTWDFAVFEFHDGPATRDGVEVDAKHHTMLLHGSGPSGSNGSIGDGLRECRHIWWGEDGYTFYLHFATVEAALRELRRWFDGH